MSNSIDTRVVEMMFKNSDFERGVQSTLKSLENLKKGLKLDNVSTGLDRLNEKAGKFNLSSLSNGISTATSKISALGVIGVTALATLASQAVTTGAAMVKNLTLGPLKDGLAEYETNLNSIQTILANTGLEGAKGLGQVNAALQELNTYSDKTIYNFSEMARNIGTFTAAGVDLKTSTAAIKGIANLAAISGSNSQQASTAMYQLSQSLASGKVSLEDWNSVVNAGMGGKVFQQSLVETAKVHGVAVDKIIKDEGSFRNSLQKGWLTSDILTETLSKFTGDLNAQQLKSMGYNEQQIAGILKMGKTAQDAATKVKTVSQLIGTLQEAAGSGWAQTFQLLFGDFEEARTLFTNVSNVLGGFIQQSANARNKVIGDWKALGGRKVLIEGLSIAFANLMDILSPIGQAFRNIFPAATGKQLYDLTVGFRDLMANLRLNEKTMDNLYRTFRGLFAIFDIGIQVIKGIATAIGVVFQSFKGGSGGILEFTGNIGDWLVALDQAIKTGSGFKNFFVGLGNVIRVPIEALKAFIGLVVDLVKNAGKLDLSGVGDRIQSRFAPLGKLGSLIANAWSGMINVIQKAWRIFQPITDLFSAFFDSLSEKISNGFSAADYNGILDGINTGLLAGLVLLFKKFLSGGINVDLGGGVLGTIKDSFEGLTGVMSAMQAQLKANTLIKIAGAIALLTASVVALSLIDSKKLASALTGLTVMFTQLLVAMAIFEKISASGGFLKMPSLAVSMIGLAIAIDLLAVAVGKLSGLSWEEMAKGLTGVAGLLASLALYSKFATVNATGISSGAGLVLLALGINILVKAVKDMSGMNWESIAKGLVGVAGLLVSLGIFSKLAAANKGGIGQGAGLLLLAVAIKVLASAMQDMGKLSWSEIAKGLTTMAGGLAIMATALSLMPPSSIFSAAGILIVALSLSKIGDAVKEMSGLSWGEIARGITAMAGALLSISVALGLLPPSSLLSAAAIFVTAASLGMIAKALGTMGGMSWGEIGKSLVVLAGSLTILAGALYLMTAALPGAAALLVAAAALRVLAPVLQAFGDMSVGEIAKSLGMLAGVFVVLGAAGLLLAPLTPIILALGIAIGILGIGVLAAGAGVFLFATALTALSVAGAAGAAAVVGIVKTLLGILPTVATALGLAIIAFAKVIATGGPAITAAITAVLLALLNAVIKLTPKIVQTFNVLMDALLATAIKYVPKITSAGMTILIGFLNGIAQKLPQVITAATNVVVAFINGISKNQNRIVNAGVDAIISFINGVANSIRSHSAELGSAGANLGLAVVEGMVRGLAGGISSVTSKAKEVASSALNAAKGVLGIKSPSKEFEEVGKFSTMGLANGLVKYTTYVTKASESVGDSAIDSLRKSISGISDVLTTDASFNPVVRPVLDLSAVEQSAKQIGPMLATKPIEVPSGYTKAVSASSGYSENQMAMAQQAADSGTNIEFTQINNSPKALPPATIYRQTKNQLSVAKEALGNT